MYAHNNPVRYTDYLGLGAEDEVKSDEEKKKKEEEEKKKKEEEEKKKEEQKKEDEKNKEQEKKDEETSNDEENVEQATLDIPIVLIGFRVGQITVSAASIAATIMTSMIFFSGDTRISNERSEYFPPPKVLPGFPDAERVPNKGRARWRTKDGDILEWDYQHGEVEVYNRQGKHQGSKKPDGTDPKPAVPGRTTRK